MTFADLPAGTAVFLDAPLSAWRGGTNSAVY
jgi:hypothetical protein